MVAIWDNVALIMPDVRSLSTAYVALIVVVTNVSFIRWRQLASNRNISEFPLKALFVACVYMRRRQLEMDGELREDVSSLKCRGAA